MLEYSLCAFESRKIIIKGGGTFGIHAPFRAIPNSLYLLLPLELREGDFEAKKNALWKIMEISNPQQQKIS